ncbi:MAG: DUF4465 domain-containing protein, partial [Pirellulaceae bacterium]|nr:DUF4465 domain-containing protein [Pirellulaceae bacterium]
NIYNGNSGGGSNSDGWISQDVVFSNNYSSDFGGFWSGWSYSTVANNTTAGPSNQYAAFTGGGADSNGAVVPLGTYAVAFGDGAFFNLPNHRKASSLLMTNTTYTALAVRDGNDGGNNFITGAFGSMASISVPGYSASLDPNGYDYLRVTLTGHDGTNATGSTTGSVTKYLADYRADKSDNPDADSRGNDDYVLDDWSFVDLTSLGAARSISLSFETTDIGDFGPNSPTLLAIDNLTLLTAPEPSSALVLSGFGLTALLRRRRN